MLSAPCHAAACARARNSCCVVLNAPCHAAACVRVRNSLLCHAERVDHVSLLQRDASEASPSREFLSNGSITQSCCSDQPVKHLHVREFLSSAAKHLRVDHATLLQRSTSEAPRWSGVSKQLYMPGLTPPRMRNQAPKLIPHPRSSAFIRVLFSGQRVDHTILLQRSASVESRRWKLPDGRSEL